MNISCTAPDPSVGIALTLSDYLDCQARALGENGFQALAGGPVGTSLLTGLITIFVALIGYRLILGQAVEVRDGIQWTVRLGFVLALVTGWPAFQTLVYRVAVDGPAEVAGIILPAGGLPTDGLDWRVQQAYDTIRLGSNRVADEGGAESASVQPPSGQPPASPAQPLQFQQPMPMTASLLVLGTSGFTGAFKIAIGFLLAVAPIPIMALLFDATLGIFSGWIRALAGMALANLATIAVTSIALTVVETEIAHLQAMRSLGNPQAIDPQGLTTIVSVFAMVMLVTALAALRMASAFRLPAGSGSRGESKVSDSRGIALPVAPARRSIVEAIAPVRSSTQTRAAETAAAVASAARREQLFLIEGAPLGRQSERSGVHAGDTIATPPPAVGLGVAGRRSTRRTRSAARRDTMR